MFQPGSTLPFNQRADRRKKNNSRAPRFVAEAVESRLYLSVQVAFGPGIVYGETGDPAISFTIGRFNAGTIPDLGVLFRAVDDTNTYATLLGQGDGSFKFKEELLNYVKEDDKLATGDWNGDGNVDLFSSRLGDNTGIASFRGDGQGNLLVGTNNVATLYYGDGLRDYTTADMTGDGKTDVITAGARGLLIQRSNGVDSSGFGTFTTILADTSSTFLTVNAIDVNGDGRRDLIAGNQISGGAFELGVRTKNADGSYQGLRNSPLTAVPVQVRMADFNGDGVLDAAVLEHAPDNAANSASIDILIGNGDGSYRAPANYPLNAPVGGFAVGDFELDGRVDVAFTLPTVPGLGLSRTFGILHNRGDGTMERVSSPLPGPGADQMDTADFNGDGKPDLIVRYADTHTIGVLLNKAVPMNVIRGQVFNDLNQDGVREFNEPGVANRRIFADLNDDGIFTPNEDSTTTLADGTWEMRVPNGLYRIRQELPARWIQTAPYTVPGQKTVSRLVSVSGIVTSSGNDFGTYDPGNISGFVYNDADASHTFDPFESGRPGQIVYIDADKSGTLSNGDTISVTDANGQFKFIVPPGVYTIRTVVAAGWQATTPLGLTVTLASSTSYTNIANFGQTQPATVSGRVYYDYSVNGRYDASEDASLGGFKLILDLNKNGIADAGEPTTTSSSSADPTLTGRYQFTGLYPGNYSVLLVKPAGYQQVSPSSAGAGVGGPFNTFAYGGADTTYTDFGVYRPIFVSGKVYRDSNGNGVADAGEAGLADITVFIDYNGNGLPELNEPQTRTDANGNYTLASSRPGAFNLRAIRRSGLNSTAPSSSLYALNFAYGAAALTGKNFGMTEGPFSNAPYLPPINITTGSNPVALVSGDFNGDGKQDFIVASNSGTSQVYLGKGNGLFTAGQQLSIGDSTRYMIAVDVNGDGKLDLVAANEAIDFGASVLIGNGNGTFKDPVDYAVTTNTYGVAAADFNGDGKKDLAYVGTTDGNVAILLNNGGGTFKPAAFIPNTFGGKSVFAGDVNGDGKADLVVANPGSDAISVLIGNGKGGFTKMPNDITSGITQPNFVTLADLNNDGKLDLIAINQFSDEVRVLLGNGNGTFGNGHTYSTASTPTQVAVLDVDRDGKLDLIVSCQSDGTTDISGGVSILRGRGDGTFVDQLLATAHTSPTAVAIADYNGDGKLDIVAANFFSDDVSLLINGTPGALGSIRGTIWQDTNVDGIKQATESGIPAITVFDDVNNNGVLDPGERFTLSGAGGVYALLDLPAGTYHIRTVVPSIDAQSSPTGGAAQVVTLSAGQAVTGKDIGLTPTATLIGYVFDNTAAILTGAWTSANTKVGGLIEYNGSDFLTDGNTGKGTKSARFNLVVPAAGFYRVYVGWISGSDRSNNVPIDIQTATGTRTVFVNQQINGGRWMNLGEYQFNATGGSVTIRTTGTSGLVIADAVQLIHDPTPTVITKDNSDPTGVTVSTGWTKSTSPAGFLGSNYLQDGNTGKTVHKSVKYAAGAITAGVYEVFARWTAGANRATNALYDILTFDGSTKTVTVNQQINGGQWVSLGFYTLGATGATITLRNDNANGIVVADAVQLVAV